MSFRWNVFPIFAALMASATTAGAASIGYVGTVDGNLSPAQSYNSSGGANTVATTGVGSFVVTLPGLGNGTHSNVQVNAVNDDGQAHYCTANGWTSLNRTDVTANVDCFDAAGRPLSDDFTLLYQSRRSAPSQGAIAFLLENRADIIAVGSGHRPLRRYSFNSSGGTNYVTHQAQGEFVAFLPGLSPNGNPQATAYGSAAARCEVSSWSAANQGTDVDIYCVELDQCAGGRGLQLVLRGGHHSCCGAGGHRVGCLRVGQQSDGEKLHAG